MIRYQLQCAENHRFEGWFASSEAYDRQRKRTLVTCPTCGSSKVVKAIMAPNVVTSEKATASRKSRAKKTSAPAPAAAPEPQLVANAEQRELLQRMRKIRDEVLAKSDYVGPRFAEEARRIHTEGGQERGIYGEANPADVKSLAEDGIDVFPIPVLPEDHN